MRARQFNRVAVFTLSFDTIREKLVRRNSTKRVDPRISIKPNLKTPICQCATRN